MENSIFREKSVDSVSSPDCLNDYIRVVRPSLWITLAAIILLLLGVSVWGMVGHLDTVVDASVVSENGYVYAYVNSSDFEKILDGSIIVIDGEDYKYVPDSKEKRLVVDANFSDGKFDGKIVIDSVKPISFIIN